MDLTPRVLLVRPYDQNITAPRQFAFGRTVSRQITAGGPVGAVGLVHFSGSDALQSGAVGNGIASRASLPTQRVGVNLSYGFK